MCSFHGGFVVEIRRIVDLLISTLNVALWIRLNAIDSSVAFKWGAKTRLNMMGIIHFLREFLGAKKGDKRAHTEYQRTTVTHWLQWLALSVEMGEQKNVCVSVWIKISCRVTKTLKWNIHTAIHKRWLRFFMPKQPQAVLPLAFNTGRQQLNTKAFVSTLIVSVYLALIFMPSFPNALVFIALDEHFANIYLCLGMRFNWSDTHQVCDCYSSAPIKMILHRGETFSFAFIVEE